MCRLDWPARIIFQREYKLNGVREGRMTDGEMCMHKGPQHQR